MLPVFAGRPAQGQGIRRTDRIEHKRSPRRICLVCWGGRSSGRTISIERKSTMERLTHVIYEDMKPALGVTEPGAIAFRRRICSGNAAIEARVIGLNKAAMSITGSGRAWHYCDDAAVRRLQGQGYTKEQLLAQRRRAIWCACTLRNTLASCQRSAAVRLPRAPAWRLAGVAARRRHWRDGAGDLQHGFQHHGYDLRRRQSGVRDERNHRSGCCIRVR